MVIEPKNGGPRQLACPVKMSGYTFELRRPAPQPGEHNDEILAELGYGAGECEALRQQGAIA
jgi:crotonobetainyl-CoA:carnitine CoA-transferase CaiB-like acyl-CoA transferase